MRPLTTVPSVSPTMRALAPSFERHLLATNKSPKTVRVYLRRRCLPRAARRLVNHEDRRPARVQHIPGDAAQDHPLEPRPTSRSNHD